MKYELTHDKTITLDTNTSGEFDKQSQKKTSKGYNCRAIQYYNRGKMADECFVKCQMGDLGS